MHTVAMPATFGISTSSPHLNSCPCPRASTQHKDTNGTSPCNATALLWPERPRPEPCQHAPVHAVSAHWQRQDVAHLIATVLALHPYRAVEQLLPALYTLDERPCLPCTVAVVLDQMMPHAP